jgi:endonuclease YncB( thermonuclease family)
MQELVEGWTIVCALISERTRGRRVGTCMVVVDGRDIGGEVIEAGPARDCPRFSRGRYAELEPKAARWLPLPGYCSPR